MSDMSLYDKTNPYSIYEYSKKLLGHSLREVVENNALRTRRGKGQLGQLVEELYFKYDVNSNRTPDFEKAGLELKCTPLKELKNNDLQIKERLVCNMIDYMSVINEKFEESHFLKKCSLMLLLFYLHKKDVDVLDLKFLYSVLWQLPEKDLLIIKQDYERVINKIQNGKAHLLSEGDTMYLGACRKGQKNQEGANQPFSTEKAPQRAFSLKPAYMRTILQFIKEQPNSAICNCPSLLNLPPLVSLEELKQTSFEEIILKRYEPYKGLNYIEICKRLQIPQSDAKHKYAIIANKIISSAITSIDESEEFQKSGIRLKTIRMEYNGAIKESMSFENIDYSEVLEAEDWFNSRLYEIFTSRFLFVIFREKHENRNIKIDNRNNKKEYILDNAFFWTMPLEDLQDAEDYWENIKANIRNNTIKLNKFYSIANHKKFHVRPKGTKDSYKNAARNPNGGMVDKYCYWFNQEYVKDIIKATDTLL